MAEYWADRWRGCLPPPPDAVARADRLGRDLDRYRRLQVDVAAVEDEITVLLARTDGQVLTSLPGVARNRAAAFAAHSLPIARFPDAEHLYSATGLAPAMYESATIRRRGQWRGADQCQQGGRPPGRCRGARPGARRFWGHAQRSGRGSGEVARFEHRTSSLRRAHGRRPYTAGLSQCSENQRRASTHTASGSKPA